MNLKQQFGRFRIVKILSGLKHLRDLRGNAALYKQYGIKKKPWQTLSYGSINKHSDDFPWMDKPVAAENIQKKPSYGSFAPGLQQQILQWPENGFMLLPGFFDVEKVEALERSVTAGLSGKDLRRYRSNRLVNLYKTNELVDGLFRDAALLKLISFILGKEVLPFQTLNFYQSSSQRAHSDSLHLTTEPLGYLVGVWVALEDVAQGSGEFFYYPGSHRLNYIMNKDFDARNSAWSLDARLHEKYEEKIAAVIREQNLQPASFLPKKGDAIIWHANLLHGSHPKRQPSLTRKSLVMHYFAKGVLCYHESMEKPVVFD